VNSLPKTGTRQRRDCDLNPGPSAPESSTLTTRLPSHPKGSIENFNRPNIEGRISLTSRAAKLSEGRIEPSCQPKFTPSLCESLNRMLETGGRFQHEYAMFITPCLYKKQSRLHGVLEDSWQWHQLDHMETICTSFQTDNHTHTSNFYRPDVLPGAQPRVSKHWRHPYKMGKF